jgi:hypothetical protein
VSYNQSNFTPRLSETEKTEAGRETPKNAFGNASTMLRPVMTRGNAFARSCEDTLSKNAIAVSTPARLRAWPVPET